jgi:hypothetical protein
MEFMIAKVANATLYSNAPLRVKTHFSMSLVAVAILKHFLVIAEVKS